MQRRILWDIETGPATTEVLQKFYEAPAPFDEEKCKAKYKTARVPGAKGEQFLADKREDAEHEAKEHWEKFVADAALSPVTGRIVAIGLRENGKNTLLIATNETEEKEIIRQFLGIVVEVLASGGIMEGFNTDLFDLGFVFRRGLRFRLNVQVLRRGRYWLEMFRDLLVVWQAGDRRASISLNKLAEFLGTAHRKNGDGAHFAAVFAKDRAKAIAYLENDLLMTEEVSDILSPMAAVAADSDDVPFAPAA